MANQLIFYSCLMAFAALVLSVCLYPVFIPMLRRLKFGQQIRNDGPESHLEKQGTPTMGGCVFILVFLLGSVIFAIKDTTCLVVSLVTVAYGLIGFADDFIKIKKKRSLGLTAKQKIVLQAVVMIAFLAWFLFLSDIGTKILIPFTGGAEKGIYLDIKYGIIPLFAIAVLGTVNGANLTDGLDGLCGKVSSVILAFFLIAALSFESALSPVIAVMIGAVLGFVVYNAYPAKIFMGDTGSLALGAFVICIAFVLRMPLFVILVAAIYLAEVISVMIQVLYFKATGGKLHGGKRFFRMAPLHHHYELGGMKETKIVTIFTIVTVAMSLLCLIGLTYR